MFMANVCCSIEMEPRTLNQGQLNIAREVAADVVQKLESNEATIIHIKGLEPVKEEQNEQILKEENLHKHVESNCTISNERPQVIEGPCQCTLTNINAESPDQINLKEPLSAPF